MKRIKAFLMCLCLWGMLSPLAAQRDSEAGRERRRGENIEKQAERMADEFGLKDEARMNFLSLYKNYRQDVMRHRMAETQFPEGEMKKETDLTDEEASARIQAEFDRKAQSIVDAYNRLEVEKKYYQEFSKTLSPKQLMRIFAPMRDTREGRDAQSRGGRNGNRQGGRGFGGMPGGFGGGDEWGD